MVEVKRLYVWQSKEVKKAIARIGNFTKNTQQVNRRNNTEERVVHTKHRWRWMQIRGRRWLWWDPWWTRIVMSVDPEYKWIWLRLLLLFFKYILTCVQWGGGRRGRPFGTYWGRQVFSEGFILGNSNRAKGNWFINVQIIALIRQ